MTTGERIQCYRKKCNLSQEALGEKLFVSRQTVSLWEMDKTLPTVDNLLLLKEIFSVSVDDILCDTEPTDEKEETETSPKESYTVKYEKEDLQAVSNKASMTLVYPLIFFAVVSAILLYGIITANSPGELIFVALGFFLMGLIVYAKSYNTYRKAWENSFSVALKNTYSYEVFDGYFTLKVSRDGEIKTLYKLNFDEVERTQTLGNYLVLQILGKSYILKKDSIKPDSVFLTCCKNDPDTIVIKRTRGVRRIVSFSLVALSLISVVAALCAVANITAYGSHTMTENMWVFFLFLPLPVSSVIFGYYLKKNGYFYKKNVIIGYIMAIFLCLYGAFSFLV